MNEHAVALGQKGGSVKSPAKAAAAAANLAKNRNQGRKPKLHGLVEAQDVLIKLLTVALDQAPIKWEDEMADAAIRNAQQRILLEREKAGRKGV